MGASVAPIDNSETTTVHTVREITRPFQPQLCMPAVTNGMDNFPFRVFVFGSFIFAVVAISPEVNSGEIYVYASSRNRVG